MKEYVIHLFTTLFLIVSIPAFSSTITNSDIDRLLKSTPITSHLLERVKTKVNTDDDLSTKLSIAKLEGQYMRELVNELRGWPEYPELEEMLKQSGFTSVDDWSLLVDRVFSVVSSVQWVVFMASNPKPNSDSTLLLTHEINLFEFLSNSKYDSRLRDKYEKQLEQMCEKLCYDRSDLSIIGARYREIEPIINKYRLTHK
jgi:hypothetical protein